MRINTWTCHMCEWLVLALEPTLMCAKSCLICIFSESAVLTSVNRENGICKSLLESVLKTQNPCGACYCCWILILQSRAYLPSNLIYMTTLTITLKDNIFFPLHPACSCTFNAYLILLIWSSIYINDYCSCSFDPRKQEEAYP